MPETIDSGGVSGRLAALGEGRARAAVQGARTSLWLIPATLGVLAVGLAEILARTDLLQEGAVETGTFGGDAEAARSVLSTIATSALTVLGVTLTITLAVLALTAQAYSPRAIRRFLRDPLLQWVVGVFVATTAFALTTLRQVQDGDVPALSVTVAIALAFLTLGMLIALFHHIAREIRVESIIASIHADALAASPDEEREYGAGTVPPVDPGLRVAVDVPARATGHVTWINDPLLARLAARAGGRSEVVAGPGDWVQRGDTVVTLWLPARADARTRRRASRAVRVATHRTIAQDDEFALLQLADISMRALSPSLNDATTAREALAHGGDLLRRLAGRRLGAIVFEEDGNPVHVRALPDWDRLCGTLVDEPRRTSEATRSVPGLVTLLEVLADVAASADDPVRLESLRRRARQIVESAERAVPDARDRRTIARLAERVVAHPVAAPVVASGETETEIR